MGKRTRWMLKALTMPLMLLAFAIFLFGESVDWIGEKIEEAWKV